MSAGIDLISAASRAPVFDPDATTTASSFSTGWTICSIDGLLPVKINMSGSCFDSKLTFAYGVISTVISPALTRHGSSVIRWCTALSPRVAQCLVTSCPGGSVSEYTCSILPERNPIVEAPIELYTTSSADLLVEI